VLQEGVTLLLEQAAGLDPSTRLFSSLHFFIYDSVKILFLLFVMITAVGYLRTYLPASKMKRWIAKKPAGIGNAIAAGFGALTPFCSCSSIPLFLSFIRAGIPLGIAFSFLVTSPLVNEYLVVIMFGLFGWKITIAYIIIGMTLGIAGGLFLGKLGLERQLEPFMAASEKKEPSCRSFDERLKAGLNEAKDITKKIWLWVLAGVGIGAAIHNYLPEGFLQATVGASGIFTLPLAVALGVPMYANCAAVVPVAVVLFQKGMPLGTALAFLMASSALSLPEAVILRKAMKLKAIAIFFAIIAAGILLSGYLLNTLQPLLI